MNRIGGSLSQLQPNPHAKDIEVKTRQPVHVKEMASSPGSAPKINVQPLSKPFLKGGVGRAQNAREDVALVQAALANIKSPNGQPYWQGRLSGSGTMALIQAINAFEISIGQKRSSKILPGSPAEAAMVNMLPPDMRHLRCVPGTEAVYCTTEVPIDIERLVRQTEQSQSMHPMNRSAVAALQRGVFKDTGLCLVSRNVNLAGNNNVAPVTFECADTIWLGQDGRPSQHPSRAIPNQQVLNRVTDIASQYGLSISSGHNGLEATNPAAEKFYDEMSLISQGAGAGIAKGIQPEC
ncbi:MAG: hypothetical protein ACPG1C_15100 [Alphaproteobacteria bacterium]